MPDNKVRENRLRRMASRQGYALVKSRRRDRRALDYGRYWLRKDGNTVVLGDVHGASQDDVEAFLTAD